MAVIPNRYGMLMTREAFSGGRLTDYLQLCAAHVPAVRQVLAGERLRYRLRYDDAVIYFDHGCLLSRAFFQNRLYGLPMFFRADNGSAGLRALPTHQQQGYKELWSLPKGVLLFYFTLLKESFNGMPLVAFREDPASGAMQPCTMPDALRPILSAVGWPIAQGADAGR